MKALVLAMTIVTIPAAGEPQWQAYAALMESRHELPAGLVGAVCRVESHWRNGLVGADGEIGICQLKPGTVRGAFGEPEPLTRPVIALGSRGPAVAALQLALGLPTTGIFDPASAHALQEWQSAHGLAPDGIAGPKTYAALYGVLSVEDALWLPERNIEYAARYLAWLSARLNTKSPAILAAAYNGGPANAVVKYLVKVEKARGVL